MDRREGEKAASLAGEFLRLREEGRAPDLGAFLRGVPAELRDATQRELAELERVAASLSAAADGEAAGPPSIPGFRVERLLGEGALGRVYAAWDETLERRVALKVLRDDAGRGAVLEEARKAAALEDPSIVTIHSITGGDAPALVMELVEGFPIDTAAVSLTFRQKARLLHACARALAVAHAHGIVHRDLKPANILVTPDLRPKVLDFGLALRAGGRADEGGFVGTPLYASPEQARGERATPRSDVYALGAVMFLILTGRPPFSADDAGALLRRIQTEDPPFPRALAPRVPEDLQSICLACLARDPADRPDAADVAADLGRFLAGEPARLRPALYRDVLHRRIAAHTGDLDLWEDQGIISHAEADRLDAVYRRILADEEHWVFDSRRLSFPQVLLYAATWTAVVGAALLLWFARDALGPHARWGVAAGLWAMLAVTGTYAYRRREVVGANAFLAGAVLATGVAALAVLVEAGVPAPPPDPEYELFAEPFTNLRLLLAAGAALLASLAAWTVLRLTAFAWTSAFLVAATWFAWLLVRDLGALDEHEVWARLLPLALLEAPALLCERRGRVRWALPFHLLALAFLVLPLDGFAAADGWARTFDLRDLASSDRRRFFGLAWNGLLLLGLMAVLERARSLDLRRGARFLQLLVPVHLVGALYLNAAENGAWLDLGFYLAAVVLLLALGPWRTRHWFLTGGLAGIALGSHLLLDLGKVDPAPFTVGLVAAGLLGALATYLYLRRRAG